MHVGMGWRFVSKTNISSFILTPIYFSKFQYFLLPFKVTKLKKLVISFKFCAQIGHNQNMSTHSQLYPPPLQYHPDQNTGLSWMQSWNFTPSWTINILYQFLPTYKNTIPTRLFSVSLKMSASMQLPSWQICWSSWPLKFKFHPEKSALVPEKQLQFLRFIIDSVDTTVFFAWP